MNRFAALMAASLLASLVALGAELTTALPHTQAAWASAENDLGEVDPSLKLTHLTIVLNRPAERQSAFEALLRQQQDPSSLNFHRWLTPEEIGQEFGPAAQDLGGGGPGAGARGPEGGRGGEERGPHGVGGPGARGGGGFRTPPPRFSGGGGAALAPRRPPADPRLARGDRTLSGRP